MLCAELEDCSTLKTPRSRDQATSHAPSCSCSQTFPFRLAHATCWTRWLRHLGTCTLHPRQACGGGVSRRQCTARGSDTSDVCRALSVTRLLKVRWPRLPRHDQGRRDDKPYSKRACSRGNNFIGSNTTTSLPKSSRLYSILPPTRTKVCLRDAAMRRSHSACLAHCPPHQALRQRGLVSRLNHPTG
jgi:hypothetical protein